MSGTVQVIKPYGVGPSEFLAVDMQRMAESARRARAVAVATGRGRGDVSLSFMTGSVTGRPVAFQRNRHTEFRSGLLGSTMLCRGEI